MIKIGINGFGRIGRAIFKSLQNYSQYEVAHINDINPNIENISYLLKYDSTYGKLDNYISHNSSNLIFDDSTIKITHQDKIDRVDWNKSNIDILIDSTGVDSNILNARNLKNKLKRVIITKSTNLSDKEIILGVNENKLTKKDFVISSSICDANACAHILDWIDKKYKIINGHITTLHPWLSYQNLVDNSPINQSNPSISWPDFALGRSSVGTLIPKNTTLIDAVSKVLPSMEKKITCFSYRVPTDTVASADITLNINQKVKIRDFKNFLKKKSEDSKHIIINDESLISIDYQKTTNSAFIDNQWTKVNKNMIKLILWYDNEWGYSNIVCKLIKHLY